LGPPAHYLTGVQLFERDTGGGHGRSIVIEADGRVGRGEIEPACSQDQWLTGVDLHLLPGVISRFGQLDITRRVIGKTDDAAVVFRASSEVAELELLDSEHVGSDAPGCPVCGGAADPTKAENPDPEVGHIRPSRYRRMSIE
jgi:hypothetical protein